MKINIFELIKKKRIISREDFCNLLFKSLGFVISYIYVPIVLEYLGIEKYGIWQTLLALLSWIGFFDIGIGNGLRNSLVIELDNDNNVCKKLVSSAFYMMFLIVIVFIGVFCAIYKIFDWNIILGVKTEYRFINQLVLLSFIFVSLNFVFSLSRSVLYALQKSSYVSFMEFSCQILNLIGIIMFSFFSKGSIIAVALIYGVSISLVNIIACLYLNKKDERFSINPSFFDRKVGLKLVIKGSKFFIIQICALVLFSTDSLIISRLFGAKNVTPYSMVNKVFAIFIGLYGAFISPVWSKVTKEKKHREYNELERIIKKSIIWMGPFIIISLITMILFDKISLIWLNTIIYYDYLLIINGLIYCVLSLWCNLWAAIINGLEFLKFAMIVAVAQAIINIPLSLLFALSLDLGVTGVFMGTNGVMLLAAVALPIRYLLYYKELRTENNGKTIS